MTFALVGFLAAILIPREFSMADQEESRTQDMRLKEYALLKDGLGMTETERRRAMASLYQVSARIRKVNRRKSLLTDEMIYMKSNAELAAKSVVALESKLKFQRERLSKRLRAMYKLSGENTLRILFSSLSPQDLDRNLYLLRAVSKRDYGLIKDYESSRTQYSLERKGLADKIKKLARVHQQIAKQEKILMQDQRSKSELVRSLERSRGELLRKISQLRSDSRESEDTIESSFFEKRGKLPPPLPIRPKRRFGVIRSEKYSYRLSHKGWTYLVDRPKEIKNVFKGEVSYSGPVPGFGNVVIIDHGDHYYSVFGFLPELKLRQGQMLEQGAKLASLSQSLPREIYFEIRHFSDSENPEDWIDESLIAGV